MYFFFKTLKIKLGPIIKFILSQPFKKIYVVIKEELFNAIINDSRAIHINKAQIKWKKVCFPTFPQRQWVNS